MHSRYRVGRSVEIKSRVEIIFDGFGKGLGWLMSAFTGGTQSVGATLY